MNHESSAKSIANEIPEFKLIEKYATWLDSKFKIPGTNSTIGLDPIIGMIPIAGDVAGYGFSIILIYYLIKHGASKMLVLKMVGNATLDALIGLIPVIGTIFDFAYKANDRNYRMLLEYHKEGKHKESTLPFFLVLLAVAVLFSVAFIWISFQIMNYFISLLQ